MELSNTFVCVMGMGVVFIGLICLIAICKLTGFICAKAGKKPAAAPAAPAAPAPAASQEIPNRREMIAAISAAIAEDLGTDISAIRIHSIKKL